MPEERSDWDKNAQQRHEQLTRGKDITFSNVLAPKIMEIVQKTDGFSAFSVLDIGCGTGVLSQMLCKHVDQVTGIDPSIASVKIGREYTRSCGNVSFSCVTIQEFRPDETNLYDMAIAHMVLHSIANLSDALNVIAASLKHEGTFIFSIPHPCFWPIVKPQLFESSRFSYHIASSHRIPFTINKEPDPLPATVPYEHRSMEIYSEVLQNAGFVIERIHEPMPTPEIAVEYTRPWRYPGFLIVVCKKLR